VERERKYVLLTGNITLASIGNRYETDTRDVDSVENILVAKYCIIDFCVTKSSTCHSGDMAGQTLRSEVHFNKSRSGCRISVPIPARTY
jgi:hypothetical protein